MKLHLNFIDRIVDPEERENTALRDSYQCSMSLVPFAPQIQCSNLSYSEARPAFAKSVDPFPYVWYWRPSHRYTIIDRHFAVVKFVASTVHYLVVERIKPQVEGHKPVLYQHLKASTAQQHIACTALKNTSSCWSLPKISLSCLFSRVSDYPLKASDFASAKAQPADSMGVAAVNERIGVALQCALKEQLRFVRSRRRSRRVQ